MCIFIHSKDMDECPSLENDHVTKTTRLSGANFYAWLVLAILSISIPIIVTYQRPYTSPLSSTALLQNLHWLPIEWRVHFKLATLAYKALHNGQPPYLS